MTYADVGTDFVEHAGYNKWAEGNNMVMYVSLKRRR
jgi:hypothetical protein